MPAACASLCSGCQLVKSTQHIQNDDFPRHTFATPCIDLLSSVSLPKVQFREQSMLLIGRVCITIIHMIYIYIYITCNYR